MTETGRFSFKVKQYITGGKKLLILYANQPIQAKSPIELKDNCNGYGLTFRNKL